MIKAQLITKKSVFISFFKNFGSFFFILPCEDTTYQLTKKYFSNTRISDRDEIYNDWKQVGDDIRFSLNENQPTTEEHICKTNIQSRPRINDR